MSRCIGLNKYGKKCRTRINKDKLICCDAHKPLNDDILEYCAICCKENLKSSEIATLMCGHCFHKDCLNECLENAVDKTQCPYCRKKGIKKIEKDKWRMRSFYRSPFYTTNWADILKVS